MDTAIPIFVFLGIFALLWDFEYVNTPIPMWTFLIMLAVIAILFWYLELGQEMVIIMVIIQN